MSSADSVVASAARQSVHDLYSDHHGWLYAWLRRRLQCPEQAADLAQDTYLRVLTSPRCIVFDKPRAFLTTIAKGLLIDHVRRAALERAYLEALASAPEAEQCSPERQFLVIETLLEIDRLLAGVSYRARTAFLLDRVDGLPQAEIAARLGVSERRIRQYITQAMRQCYLARFGELA